MFEQIEKKAGTNISVVMCTHLEMNASAGAVTWKSTNTITSSMHLPSAKGSRDALHVSHLEARDATNTPKNDSIMYAVAYMRCSYSNPRTGSAVYALSPFLGRANRVSVGQDCALSNQKMRGGIAG